MRPHHLSLDDSICNEPIEEFGDICDSNCNNYTHTFKNNWTEETVASRYNLICKDSAGTHPRIHDANTIGLGGLLAGAFVFGTLSDL